MLAGKLPRLPPASASALRSPTVGLPTAVTGNQITPACCRLLAGAAAAQHQLPAQANHSASALR
ncbi:MAG: hypothetical protein U0Z44_09490 [Kouleothrix sp.]